MKDSYFELIVWDTGLTSISDLTPYDSSCRKECWEEVYSNRYLDDRYVRAIDEFLSAYLLTFQLTWHYAVILHCYSDCLGDEVVKEFFFKGDGK